MDNLEKFDKLEKAVIVTVNTLQSTQSPMAHVVAHVLDNMTYTNDDLPEQIVRCMLLNMHELESWSKIAALKLVNESK